MPKQETHASGSGGFLVWALPEVKIDFESSVLIKFYIITIFFEQFV